MRRNNIKYLNKNLTKKRKKHPKTNLQANQDKSACKKGGGTHMRCRICAEVRHVGSVSYGKIA
jgi:hypothetical protein